MNRSRMVLVIAWGLLATGLLAQLVYRGDDASQETTGGADPSAQLAFDAGDRADESELDTVDDDASGEAESAETETAGDDSIDADANPAGEIPLAADDPALWNEAGVVLPKESLVATVTNAGVASMAEPTPGAVQHFFPNPTQFGGDRTFLVIDNTSSEDYVKVSLPVMPNGQEGWIPRSDVEISTVEHRAVVDLSDDSVTVWDGDEIVVDTKAVTGKPSTPTPLGLFYVRDVIPQANTSGGYGPYILALSGFSEVLETFDGGLPALAIHGTNNPDQIGSERSSGCVRIPNDLITLLADTVPLGTPVTIVA